MIGCQDMLCSRKIRFKYVSTLFIIIAFLLPDLIISARESSNYKTLSFTYQDTIKNLKISGIVNNNFFEPVDSIKISIQTKTSTTEGYTAFFGRFSFNIPGTYVDGDSIRLIFARADYHLLDTLLSLKDSIIFHPIQVIVYPKYKILLKGRLFAGSMPVENADVTVIHQKDTLKLKTLGCYYDDEDYWNCLYNGMFKTEIIADNPNDSIYILCEKVGYQPENYGLKFSDYSGDILKFKMRYADTLPALPGNNLALKLSNPFGGDWLVGLSYYANINGKLFNRLKPGIEISMSTLNRSITLTTLPGVDETKFDTVYTSYFIGPSLVFFLTKPSVRRFSTYLGSTFSLKFNGGDFVYQPFIGTRFFIDMRKSFSIDIRYLNYHVDIKEYSFRYNGNAIRNTRELTVQKLRLNLGFQINF